MGLPLRLTEYEELIIIALRQRPAGMTIGDIGALLGDVDRRDVLDMIYKLRSLGIIRRKESTSSHYRVWVLK